MSSNDTWISRNPKKLGIMLFISFLFLLLFVTDRLIGRLKPTSTFAKREIVRAINLREHHPGLDIIINPDEYYMSMADNLVDQDYPFRVDEDGFLLPNNNHENPDFKIVFIGGSTTECMYVSEDKRFPYLVGTLLEDRTDWKINTYNSGASGNSSIHSLDILLNKIIPMNPDVVVFMHAINDYAILAYDHTYWPVGTPRSEVIIINDYFPKIPEETFIWHLKSLVRMTYPNMYQRLHILKNNFKKEPIEREHWDEWHGRRHYIKDRDFEFMQKEFRWAIQMLVTASKSHNIIPVLMTQANRLKDDPDPFIIKNVAPITDHDISYEIFKQEYDTFNQIVREVALSNNIPLIDLAKLVPQENDYMYDVVHLNDNGSIFIANIIQEHLIKILETN